MKFLPNTIVVRCCNRTTQGLLGQSLNDVKTEHVKHCFLIIKADGACANHCALKG